MTNSKTILVLGAGIGGQVTATRLRKKLSKQHKVLLFEREQIFVFQPSLLWMMTGERSRENISRTFSSLSKKGIEFIRGEVTKIDPKNRSVTVNEQEYRGDYLVIALGADLAPDIIPGLAEAGFNLYNIQSVEALSDVCSAFTRGQIAILVGGMPFKCPAAPYEAAMLLESYCRKRHVRKEIEIDLYTPEPGPMPVAGPEVSGQVRNMLKSKGIGYHTQRVIKNIDPSKKTIVFANGDSTAFDLLIYIPPHKAPRVVKDALMLNEAGWVSVNRHTLETPFPGVYAIGDIVGIPLSMGKPLPKAGVFAEGQAKIVADNLVHRITNTGKYVEFEGYGECFVETGDGKAGFGSGNFYAEPEAEVKLKQPGRLLHIAKVFYEKYWLHYRL